MANKYLLIHRHEYGTSHAIFEAKGFDPQKIDEDQSISLAKACGLDFEPQKNEELEVVSLEEQVYQVSKKDIQ